MGGPPPSRRGDDAGALLYLSWKFGAEGCPANRTITSLDVHRALRSAGVASLPIPGLPDSEGSSQITSVDLLPRTQTGPPHKRSRAVQPRDDPAVLSLVQNSDREELYDVIKGLQNENVRLSALNESFSKQLCEFDPRRTDAGTKGKGCHLTSEGEWRLWRKRNTGHCNVASLLQILAVDGCKNLVLGAERRVMLFSDWQWHV